MSATKLTPFDLGDVPASMGQFVYEGERERGSVYCPGSVYMLVLALRAILSDQHSDYYGQSVEKRYVFWECKDEYGFEIALWLYEPKVEDFDSTMGKPDPETGLVWGDTYVVQEHRYVKLATVRCCTGEGLISSVWFQVSGAYGVVWSELCGERGVRRLLEDAVHASDPYSGFRSLPDGVTTLVNLRNPHYFDLEYRLHVQQGRVSGITAELVSKPSLW